MEKMSMKSYAVKHKHSVFSVMKMVKSGKLDTQIEEIDGREILYILIDKEKELKESSVDEKVKEKENMILEEEFALVKKEVYRLRDEIEILKKRLH